MTGENLRFVPLEQLTARVPGMPLVMVGYWWLTHPEHGAAFYVRKGSASPQANLDSRIGERFAAEYLWAETVQIDVAFLPTQSALLALPAVEDLTVGAVEPAHRPAPNVLCTPSCCPAGRSTRPR